MIAVEAPPSPHDPAALELLGEYFGIAFADHPQLWSLLQPVALAGGQWLFRQDTPGDALFLLVRGRLRAWRDLSSTPGEQDVLLGEIAPGECVGEAGLLTGQPRSAGVRAIRDSVLVRVDRHGFEQLARHNPALVMKLAASVAGRMRENMQPGAAGRRPPRTIALLPLDDSSAVHELCNRLATALGAPGEAIELRRTLGIDQPVDAQLAHWIGQLETRHAQVLFRCDAAATPWSSFCLRQADLVLRVAEASAEASPRDWERTLGEAGDRSSGSNHALLLLQPAGDGPITGTLAWLEARDLAFHLHARDDDAGDLARVARILSGKAIGLVLGAGAARGFAHLGVYRAMHEAGVPVDWVGGSSIGSIMGAAIAQDWTPERAIRVAHDSFVLGKPFSDYTLPLVSLLSGGRMRRLLRKHMPGNLEDMVIPFFCLSSNLSTGLPNVHTRGTTWKILSASAALPGVLPPAVHQGQLAIDGSVLNSLPVDVMQAMPVARVVAVDLGSRKDHRIDYKHVPSAWSLLWQRLSGRKRKVRVPGLATLILKATEIGTVARVRELGAQADLSLVPPVNQFSILDVSRFHDIVEAGYAHAGEALPGWLLREGLRSPAEAVPSP
jgi:NTE family protein